MSMLLAYVPTGTLMPFTPVIQYLFINTIFLVNAMYKTILMGIKIRSLQKHYPDVRLNIRGEFN